MDVLVNVVNQKLKIPTYLKNYVEGTQKYIRFIFNLSNEWLNLSPFAQFTQNGKSYNIYLDDEKSVYLPPEITAGTCTLMLYGTDGDIIGLTNQAVLNINENMINSDAGNSEITPSLYNQLVEEIEALEKLIKEGNGDDCTCEDSDLLWIEF